MWRNSKIWFINIVVPQEIQLQTFIIRFLLSVRIKAINYIDLNMNEIRLNLMQSCYDLRSFCHMAIAIFLENQCVYTCSVGPAPDRLIWSASVRCSVPKLCLAYVALGCVFYQYLHSSQIFNSSGSSDAMLGYRSGPAFHQDDWSFVRRQDITWTSVDSLHVPSGPVKRNCSKILIEIQAF